MKSICRLITIAVILSSLILFGCATTDKAGSGTKSDSETGPEPTHRVESESGTGDTVQEDTPLLQEATPQDFEGMWLGTLSAGGNELRLVFHFSIGESGELSVTMDSPDQNVSGIPASEVEIEGRTIEIEIASARATYQGELAADGEQITGTWNQAGGTYSVDLKTVDEVEKITRPQDPERPLPYVEEKVRFENSEDGIELAGTLTMPEGDGPFPAVVLISGSGAQDRNEEVANHRPFLVLSDHLTRNGIAVLRFDDRGFGESEGDAASATSADLARDAWSAAHYLLGRERVDSRSVGMLGHSEGGVIAPIVATERKEIAFLVLLAAPGIPGDELLVAQTEAILRASGVSESQIGAISQMNRQIYEIIKNEDDVDALRKRLVETLRSFGMPEQQIDAQVAQLTSPWYRFFLSYDPAQDLSEVSCPVLALAGSLDLQVPADENLSEIESALKRGGNDDVTTRKLEGLNHLFQHAETGLMNEYAQIEETFAPEAMDIIAEWIHGVTAAGEEE